MVLHHTARRRATWPVPTAIILGVFGLISGFLPVGIGCGSAFLHPDYRELHAGESVATCQQNAAGFGATAWALLLLGLLILGAYLLLPGRMVADPPTGAVATLASLASLRDQGVITEDDFTARTAQILQVPAGPSCA